MAVKRNTDGTIDKRTKEGKAIAERMAKARAARAKASTTKKSTSTTTKKTTAAKPTTAAKKTTVKKTTTVAKKTTSAATSSAGSITVTGNKKIGTLQKEFNKKFPYLRLGIFYSYARQQVKKGETITQIDGDKTLASVRRADSGGTISIAGNKKISSLEKEFDTAFGLYTQVCYTDKDGKRYYTSGSSDAMTLSAFNALCEKNGCKKGVYR